MKSIFKEVQYLRELLLNEDMKVPDKSGATPLMIRAKINSEISPLSAEKKFEEEVVCRLAQQLNGFTQINFSELESYITISNFTNNKIVEIFERYIRNEEQEEDIVLKACVTRFIQHLTRSVFSLEYIKRRFSSLNKLDPWLLAELEITCNWKAGVEFIRDLLITNPDTSYLFSLLPTWMNEEDDQDKISYALTEWFDHFNINDKEIANYYAENYGYQIGKKTNKDPQFNSEAVNGIVDTNAYRSFFQNRSEPNFESLLP